ncbi:hypothetical protein GIB67_039030 [Kingdonia uniflora]|uniref:Trichome birefringence-like C-terminal domain-containing protein n=1 Tax=Kingdonia uniflora TaxID=39325 RepID=A0A7J7LKT2_9MAGN|nr:hypothetical protein GIB67_039030 [Kingdonia uniflora]
MLSSTISDKDSIYEMNGNLITKHNGFLVYKFKDFNRTVEYYRAPFLVLQSRVPDTVEKKVKTIQKLDQMDITSTQWRDADILIFNSALWWNYEKRIRGGCYFQEAEDVKMNMTVERSADLRACLHTSSSGLDLPMKDGRLRIFEWPSLRILLDDSRAHKSFQDLDVSLDSEFLASTSTDVSARIWNINEGVPLTLLTRNSDEKIECCRFFKDGTKLFLFSTVQKGDKAVTAVWDISTWNRIGHKRLLCYMIFITPIYRFRSAVLQYF